MIDPKILESHSNLTNFPGLRIRDPHGSVLFLVTGSGPGSSLKIKIKIQKIRGSKESRGGPWKLTMEAWRLKMEAQNPLFHTENTFIMTKLKERLQSLDIYDEMVCNCHQDSTLLKASRFLWKPIFNFDHLIGTVRVPVVTLPIKTIMKWFFLQIIELVESLYYSHDNSTRHFYWNKLQVVARYQMT